MLRDHVHHGGSNGNRQGLPRLEAPAPNGNGHSAKAALEELVAVGAAPPSGAPLPASGTGAPATGWANVPDVVLSEPGLSPLARVLYAVLIAHRNSKTGLCNPGMERLEGLLGRTRRALSDALRALEGRGWLTVERAAGRVNHYQILLSTTKNFTSVARHVLYDDQLSVGAKYAYMLICSRQRSDEETCHARLETLARLAGLPVTNGKNSTMERWVAELRQRGYLDDTQRRFHQGAQRHVTLAPHQKGRARTRCLDKNGQGAGLSVKADGTNTPLSSHADTPLTSHETPRSVPTQTPRSVPTNVTLLNVTPDNERPRPRPQALPLSSDAENLRPPQEGGAPQARNDASAPSGAAGAPVAGATGSSAQGAASAAQGTRSSRDVEGPLVQRAYAYQSAAMEGCPSLYRPEEIHGPGHLHPAEGESVRAPQAPSATVLAATPPVKTRDKISYLHLKPAPLRRAAGEEPPSQALLRQADWAAQLYRQRLYGTSTSKPHVLVAERDICGLILNCIGRRKDLFERFLAYLEGEAWYYRGGGVRGEPKTYWHRNPWLLYREWFYWWTNGCPEEKKIGELRALKKEDVPWNECLGCLLSNEDDAMTTPRCPGAEHRRGCLYERPGHIGADDWRISRLVEHLRKQEENA